MLSSRRDFNYIRHMSIERIAAEALRLPAMERAMLAESLWESLVDPFKVPALADDSEAVALATERERQLESGEVQAVSHEEMMIRLRRLESSIIWRWSPSCERSVNTMTNALPGWDRTSLTSSSGRCWHWLRHPSAGWLSRQIYAAVSCADFRTSFTSAVWIQKGSE